MKTTTRHLLSIPALAAASLISLTALAAGPQFVDLDGDGVISAEEITQIRDEYMQTELSNYDTDGDGQLSRDEHDAIRAQHEAEMLVDFDTDGDGQLSRQEHEAARDAQRAIIETQLDVNQDGVLSDEELAGFEAVEAESGGRGGPNGDGPRREKGGNSNS